MILTVAFWRHTMRKILVVNRLGIGDVVLTTPLAELIKRNMEARVGYVIASKAADVLINHPYIDDVFPYDRQTKQQTQRKIRSKQYEDAIIVDERLNSTLLAWRCGCRLLNWGVEVTLGKWRFFTRKQHRVRAIEDFTSYARLIGINPDPTILRATVGNCDPGRETLIAEWLKYTQQQTQKIVLVVARTAADNKNWNTSHLSKFNTYLNNQGILPVYIGAPVDYDYIEAIGGAKINIAGKFGLRDLPVIARHAAFALSMCTGPLHILGTVDLPIIAIYGQSDPIRWAPKTAIILQSKLPCAPCFHWAKCERQPGDTCMDEISFDQVRQIIEKHRLLE